MDADGETYADDRSHQRRYEHCADDDGCRIGVETQRGYEDSHNEDKNIDSSERDAFAYGFLSFSLRNKKT